MTEGTDAPEWWESVETAERGDLMVADDTRREYMRVERDRWDGPRGVWFDVRDPPWNKKKEVLSDCIDANEDGSGEMHLDEYYREMLGYMIVDSSADIGNNTNMFLRGLNNEAGDKLEGLVPRPSARGITEDEEGKSAGPSAAGVGDTDAGQE
jgi:hypothetical protein